MSDTFKVDRIWNWGAKDKGPVGAGSVVYGPISINFKVFNRKDGSGIWASMPQEKRKEEWKDSVFLTTDEARKGFQAAIQEAWNNLADAPAEKKKTEETDDVPF